MLTGRAHGIVCICVIFDSREDGTDLIVSILIRVAVVGIVVFLTATLPKCCVCVLRFLLTIVPSSGVSSFVSSVGVERLNK